MAEISRGNKTVIITADLVPECHFLVRNIPQSKLAVERPTEKISIILKNDMKYSSFVPVNYEIYLFYRENDLFLSL